MTSLTWPGLPPTDLAMPELPITVERFVRACVCLTAKLEATPRYPR